MYELDLLKHCWDIQRMTENARLRDSGSWLHLINNGCHSMNPNYAKNEEYQSPFKYNFPCCLLDCIKALESFWPSYSSQEPWETKHTWTFELKYHIDHQIVDFIFSQLVGIPVLFSCTLIFKLLSEYTTSKRCKNPDLSSTFLNEMLVCRCAVAIVSKVYWKFVTTKWQKILKTLILCHMWKNCSGHHINKVHKVYCFSFRNNLPTTNHNSWLIFLDLKTT